MTIPVYVLTGFLGSGKTTLLNRLLARRAARGATGRIAFIVNELGEVGIDGELLPAEATRQIELPGGCVCCVLNDSLDATLLEPIAIQRSRRSSWKPPALPSRCRSRGRWSARRCASAFDWRR